MKTNELTGTALDWAVAEAEGLLGFGYQDDMGLLRIILSTDEDEYFIPTLNWSHGGPIIEREKIELEHDGFEWWARIKADDDYNGDTPLIAAMRCYVVNKLGNDVLLPKGLA